jgi:hypothetical protein
MSDESMEEKQPASMKMPAGRGEGIVTQEVRTKVDALLSTPESYMPIIETLKILEPAMIEDLHALSNKARESMVSAGASPQLNDLIGDIIATAWLRGFLLHREAINLIDSRKLSEMYGLDFDKFGDELIDKWKQRLTNGPVKESTPKSKVVKPRRGRKPRKTSSDS